jgi:hypothetical protein
MRWRGIVIVIYGLGLGLALLLPFAWLNQYAPAILFEV